MACFHPLRGIRLHDGSISLKKSDGRLGGPPITVACGQCSGCRLEKSRQWAVRCLHESKTHEANCFITLTYTDDNLPPGGSLDLEDWQRFAKRLRHRIGPFRFFHCGEYGDQTFRPHYHAIIFGYDFAKDRKFLKTTKHGHKLYTSELLDQAWQLGHANIGAMTFESAAYVARYCLKKISGVAQREFYKMPDYERVIKTTGEVVDFIKPPYTTMSRRPGIGSNWFDKYQSDVYPSDEVIINAQRTRPPCYYDYRLGLTNPGLLEELKGSRVTKAHRHKRNNTPERLAVREKILDRKTELLTRDQHHIPE